MINKVSKAGASALFILDNWYISIQDC